MSIFSCTAFFFTVKPLYSSITIPQLLGLPHEVVQVVNCIACWVWGIQIIFTLDFSWVKVAFFFNWMHKNALGKVEASMTTSPTLPTKVLRGKQEGIKFFYCFHFEGFPALIPDLLLWLETGVFLFFAFVFVFYSAAHGEHRPSNWWHDSLPFPHL